MRTIKITEPVLVRGVHREPGEIIIVGVVDAESIVAAGKGVQVPDGTKADTAIVNRDTAPENRDPKPLTPAQQKAADKKAAAEKAEADLKAAEAAGAQTTEQVSTDGTNAAQ